jgi:hypothetical protein
MLSVTGDHKNIDETEKIIITVCHHGIHSFRDASVNSAV